GPKLIAFLKTMEFSTLTRRVAEATGAEPADIEPAHIPVTTADAHGPDMGVSRGSPSSPAGPSPRRNGEKDDGRDAGAPLSPSSRGEGKGEGQTAIFPNAHDGAATPYMLAALRAEQAVAAKI